MKKEDLLKLGLDEETAKKVADASAEELKGFIPKQRFDEVNENNKTLKTDLADRDKQLEELKKVDPAALQAKIKELEAANKKSNEDREKQIAEMRINYAIETALTTAKAKNITAVKALLKMDEITVDGETIKGLEKQIKALSESEDTKFLFGDSAKLKGMNPADPADPNPNDPPAGTGASYAQKYNAQVVPPAANS